VASKLPLLHPLQRSRDGLQRALAEGLDTINGLKR
jgi:hypothetical protein